MKRTAHFLRLVAASALFGCGPSQPSLAPCNDDDECAAQEVCAAGVCQPAVRPDADAGSPPRADAGQRDDAGLPVPEEDAGAPPPADGGAGAPEDWWHPGFGARVPLTVENDADEALAELPLLVSLTDAALVSLAGTGAGAVRFVDEDNQPLPYDVERADDARVDVWVRLPTLPAQSTTTIWLYLDHPTATTSERAAETFSAYASVYHLAGDGFDDGAMVRDGVAAGAGTVTAVEGATGLAVELAGDGYLALPDNLDHARAVPAVTTCAFIRPADVRISSVLSLAIGGGARTGVSRSALEVRDTAARYLGRALDSSASPDQVDAPGAIVVDQWAWLCGRFDVVGGSISLLKNGASIASTEGLTPHASTPDTSSPNGSIGASDLGNDQFFLGVLDELRVSQRARSDAWHRAEYLAMTGALALFGELETIARAPPPNAPPEAVEDTFIVDIDSARALLDPLVNDTDGDGDALTLLDVGSTSLGALRVGPTNQLVFVPSAGVTGSDEVSYTVGDGNGGTATGALTITVADIDAPPVAAPVSVIAYGQRAVSVTLSASDDDTAASALSYEIVTGPSAGVLTGHTDGDATLSYTASANADGVDSFTYRVSDGTSYSNTATVTVTRYRWWNTSWDDRVRIDISTAGLSGDLVDFPVLVILNSDRIDVTDINPDASDLRFIAKDGVTVLDHDVDTWGPSGGSVWVRVPLMQAGSAEHIYVYSDNPAALSAENAPGVWSSGYLGTWHMDDGADSSTFNHTLYESGGTLSDTAGIVGGAGTFGGGVLLESDSTSLAASGAFSFSAWFRLKADFDATSPTTQVLMERYDGPSTNAALMLTGADHSYLGAGALHMRVRRNGQISYAYVENLTLPKNTWHHVAVAGDPAANRLNLYLDGALVSTLVSGTLQPIDLGPAFRVGGSTLDPGILSGPRFLNGDLDEVRFANVAFDAVWIAAEVAAATDLLLSYRPQESL